MTDHLQRSLPPHQWLLCVLARTYWQIECTRSTLNVAKTQFQSFLTPVVNMYNVQIYNLCFTNLTPSFSHQICNVFRPKYLLTCPPTFVHIYDVCFDMCYHTTPSDRQLLYHHGCSDIWQVWSVFWHLNNWFPHLSSTAPSSVRPFPRLSFASTSPRPPAVNEPLQVLEEVPREKSLGRNVVWTKVTNVRRVHGIRVARSKGICTTHYEYIEVSNIQQCFYPSKSRSLMVWEALGSGHSDPFVAV